MTGVELRGRFAHARFMRVLVAICLAVGLLIAPAGAEIIGAYQMAYPYPSPDGSRVVFQGNFDGRWQLYEMIVETGAVRRLHVSNADDTHPAWSPDGAQIAFISNRDGDDEVYLLTLETREARVVNAHPGKDGHPRWSADGAALVFNRTFDPDDRDGDVDSAIVSVQLSDNAATTLSDTPNIETMGSLSPDGRFLALVEWMPADPNPMGDIVVVDLHTGARTNLTSSPEFDGYPYWGPSEWVYFSTITVDAAGAREAVLRRVRPRDGVIEDLAVRDGVGEVRGVSDAREETVFFNQVSAGRQRIDVSRAPIRPVN